ncbi:MAG: cupin domain-containing protein [Chloroflexi bacterium]|nr:cupin domain-containing protein [Chloroflexota bacterium]
MGFSVKSEDIPWSSPYEGVERQVIAGQNVMMVYYRQKPGVVFPLHSHPHEQTGFIIQGAIELLVGEKGDQTMRLDAGSFYCLEPGETHAARVVSEKEAVWVDIFSPLRADYMPEAVTS